MVALGPRGAAVLARVKHEELHGVSVHQIEGTARAGSGALDAIRASADELHKALAGADMIFIVAGLGDDVSIAPAIKRVGNDRHVPVTALLIAPAEAFAADALATLRNSVELLVIADDDEYVVTMLSALGG